MTLPHSTWNSGATASRSRTPPSVTRPWQPSAFVDRGLHLAPEAAEADARIDVLDDHDLRPVAGGDIAVVLEPRLALLGRGQAGRQRRADQGGARVADHRRQLRERADQGLRGEPERPALRRHQLERVADGRRVELAQRIELGLAQRCFRQDPLPDRCRSYVGRPIADRARAGKRVRARRRTGWRSRPLKPITVAKGRQQEAIDDHGFPNRRDARPHRRARRWRSRRRARPDPAQGLAPVAGRQGRRARRDGADHRARGGGGRRRAGHPDLSRRVAVQAHPAMGRDGPGPARHLGLPARLRERQASAVQRHPDAGPGQEPRARQAPEQFRRSWTTSSRSSTSRA